MSIETCPPIAGCEPAERSPGSNPKPQPPERWIGCDCCGCLFDRTGLRWIGEYLLCPNCSSAENASDD